jgi:hypothetical protein
MPSEVYNPNPTIFKPTQSSKFAAADKLWIEDEEDEKPAIDEEDDSVEPIDNNEIFGMFNTLRVATSSFNSIIKTSYGIYETRSIPTLWKNSPWYQRHK